MNLSTNLSKPARRYCCHICFSKSIKTIHKPKLTDDTNKNFISITITKESLSNKVTLRSLNVNKYK